MRCPVCSRLGCDAHPTKCSEKPREIFVAETPGGETRTSSCWPAGMAYQVGMSGERPPAPYDPALASLGDSKIVLAQPVWPAVDPSGCRNGRRHGVEGRSSRTSERHSDHEVSAADSLLALHSLAAAELTAFAAPAFCFGKTAPDSLARPLGAC